MTLGHRRVKAKFNSVIKHKSFINERSKIHVYKKFKIECVYQENFCLNFRLFYFLLCTSWTDIMCLLRFPFSVALYLHCGHWNFWPSWTDFMCVWRLDFLVNFDPHCMHGNCWPAWVDLMCVCRCTFWVDLYSQSKHWWLWCPMFNN